MAYLVIIITKQTSHSGYPNIATELVLRLLQQHAYQQLSWSTQNNHPLLRLSTKWPLTQTSNEAILLMRVTLLGRDIFLAVCHILSAKVVGVTSSEDILVNRLNAPSDIWQHLSLNSLHMETSKTASL